MRKCRGKKSEQQERLGWFRDLKIHHTSREIVLPLKPTFPGTCVPSLITVQGPPLEGFLLKNTGNSSLCQVNLWAYTHEAKPPPKYYLKWCSEKTLASTSLWHLQADIPPPGKWTQGCESLGNGLWREAELGFKTTDEIPHWKNRSNKHSSLFLQ